MCEENNTELFNYIQKTPVLEVIKERYLIHNHNLLHESILKHDLRSIDLLLGKAPGLCREVDNIGKTPLHYAIEAKTCFDLLQKLTECSKYVINLADSYLGIPFNYVFMKKEYTVEDYLSICRLFIDNGANFKELRCSFISNAMKRSGNNVDTSMYAKLMELLFGNGAPIKDQFQCLQPLLYKEPLLLNIKTSDNYTLFLEACKFCDLPELKHYVAGGAEYKALATDGLTPLIIFLSNSEVDKAEWYLSLDGVDPTVGYNVAQQNALTIAASYSVANLELVKLLFDSAKAAEKIFIFDQQKHHPQNIALERMLLELLQMTFEYGYMDVKWTKTVTISPDIYSMYLPLKILSMMNFDRQVTVDVDAYGMIVYHGLFRRWNALIQNDFFNLLLNYDYPLNLDSLLPLLTMMHTPWQQYDKVNMIFEALPIEDIREEVVQYVDIAENHHHELKWDLVHIFRKLTDMPDRLFLQLWRANFRIDERIYRHLGAFYVSPIVLLVLNPIFQWGHDDYFPRSIYTENFTEKIPVGSPLGVSFYPKLKELVHGTNLQVEIERLDLKNPSSLQDLAVSAVRRNCAKMALNGTQSFANYLYQYTPKPYRQHVLFRNDYTIGRNDSRGYAAVAMYLRRLSNSRRNEDW